MNRKKMAIGLIGIGLSLFLVIQGTDVLAQQILSNGSANTTNNTTASNNSTVNNAFDQLKDTFGSLFGK